VEGGIFAATGLCIGDSGGMESEKFKFHLNLNDSFLLFTQLRKKEI